jgi:hypothetical protein
VIAHNVLGAAYLGHRNGATDTDPLARICGGRGLEIMAQHEAAHAIVGLACGVEITFVSLTMPEPMTGYGKREPCWYKAGTVAAAGYIVDCRHGVAEAHRYAPKRDAAQDKVQIQSSAICIVKRVPCEIVDAPRVRVRKDLTLTQVDADAANKLAQGFCRAAEALILANLGALKSVAGKLLHARRLDGAEVLALARDVRPHSSAEVRAMVEGGAL